MSRDCDGCTVCCDGWLLTTVNIPIEDGKTKSISLKPGKPCFYKGKKGCTIYYKRPYDPCQGFECAWLRDETFPYWFKPDISNIICVWKPWKNDDHEYLEIVECGQRMDSRILSWIFTFHVTTRCNIHYQLDGGWYGFGEKEFIEWLEIDRPLEGYISDDTASSIP